MSETQRKQERDFSAEVKALQPQAEELAKNGKLQEAVDKLSALEKQTRNAADMTSTANLLTALTRLCWEQNDLDLLNAQLTIMSKKHGQLKEAVVRMVDEAMKWLPELKRRREAGEYKGEGKDRWLELVQTLRDITEGKIYLELPRARLTVLLANYHEEKAKSAPAEAESSTSAPKAAEASGSKDKDGDKEKEKEKKEPVTARDHRDVAADLMSDIQVETYSSMDKREKTDFILEQMRLESQRGNWTRVRVGSRKINRVFLKEAGSADLKLRYYDLIVQLALQEDGYLEACNAYQEVWDTEEIKKDEAKEVEVLENIMAYVVLAPYSNEQSDMLHKLNAKQDLAKSPLYHELVKCFVTKELMRWPGIETLYGETLRQSPIFASSSDMGKKTGSGIDGGAAASSSSSLQSAGDERWEQLHKRVVEHNIRVIAGYYSRITMSRLSELLDLPPLTAERTICKLVTDKTIYARINRPDGIISFKKPKGVTQTLNAWSGDIDKMLGLVEKTSHLVAKEYAMHEASRGKKIAA